TTSPSYKLHLYGTSNNAADVYSETDAARVVKHWFVNAGRSWSVGQLGTTAAPNYQFRITDETVAQARLAINTDGNVGIGTTTPSAKLEVADGDALIYGITVGRGSGAFLANTAVGYSALRVNTTGDNNTAVGWGSLYTNTTGEWNTAVGWGSLFKNTSGKWNTATGVIALDNNTSGSYNTAYGVSALMSNTTGQYNSAFGYAAYQGGTYSYSTAIGAIVSITASNQVRIGWNATSIGGPQNWTNTSDGRFKIDVEESVPGLAFITKLRPVTYHFDPDAFAKFVKLPDSLRIKECEQLQSSMLRTGFIAQEVESVAFELGYDFSGVDAPKNENDYYGLRYAEFVMPLVKAVQEQQDMIESQNKIIEQLMQRIEVLENK
ncbi:tail fiber domain-containing protein, partial [bacterium]|nr:tail fiber domain-containing protein [bacterium]